MIDTTTVDRFLAEPRIAVVGATDTKGAFGGTVYRALRDHGYEVVPVNPNAAEVAGDLCYPDLWAVPDGVRAVLVMVGAERALGVVDDCIAHGVEQVWLFKGLGAPGAVSDEAVQRLHDHGIAVVEGACPLMFLEPVGIGHRIHRRIRQARGALTPA